MSGTSDQRGSAPTSGTEGADRSQTGAERGSLLRPSILADTASMLSANRITIEIGQRGELEVTFDGGDTSWGEALSYEDTLYIAERMARWWAETTGVIRG